MRYKDRVEMDLDIIERHLGRCKDAIDAKNIAEVSNQIIQIEYCVQLNIIFNVLVVHIFSITCYIFRRVF